MRCIQVLIAVAALCLVSATTSRASQVSQPMNVSLTTGTAGGQVSLVVGPLVLSGPATGPADGTATIHITASAGLPYSISLNYGQHLGLDLLRHLVAQGGNILIAYGLTRDPEHTQRWGDGSSVDPPVSGVGTGDDQGYVVYAYAPLPWPVFQPPDGTYTDVVTATVDF